MQPVVTIDAVLDITSAARATLVISLPAMCGPSTAYRRVGTPSDRRGQIARGRGR